MKIDGTLKIHKLSGENKKPDLVKYNLKNGEARARMKQNIELDTSFDRLFVDADCDLNEEVELFMKKWNENIR